MINPMSVDKEEMLRKIKDALYVSENNPQIHHHWLRALLAENEQLHAAVEEYEERRQSALTESQRILSENEWLKEQIELHSMHPLTRAFKNLEKHQRQINASE